MSKPTLDGDHGDGDPLAPARGFLFGTILSLLLWGGIVFTWWTAR